MGTACNYLVLASSAITTNGASDFTGHFGEHSDEITTHHTLFLTLVLSVLHPEAIGNFQNPGGLRIVTDQIFYQAYTGIKAGSSPGNYVINPSSYIFRFYRDSSGDPETPPSRRTPT